MGAKVLESDERHELVETDGELIYKVKLPPLSAQEKRFLSEIKDKAIKEINVAAGIEANVKARKAELANEILKKMIEYIELGAKGTRIEIPEEAKLKAMAQIVSWDMLGYGLLDPLLEDDSLEEVMVIGVSVPVYVVHRKLGMMETNIIFESDEETQRIIEKMARYSGRKIDFANPLLDARLPDGSRINATLRPPSLDGSTITVRKFKADALTIVDLLRFGTLASDAACFLWLAVEGMNVKPSNVLVAGGTGSGKTTTLNCLSLFIPKHQRVITIEDTAELQLPMKHRIRLETKPPNVEGKGGLNFNQLLINTLRMRPDRVILGEVRGEEAATLFVAMNTGHDGCMGTVHANTASETITRLINPPMNVPRIMIPALDLIIMQNRVSVAGKIKRRITEISEVGGIEVDKVLLNRIYEHDPKNDVVRPTGVPSKLKQIIAAKAGTTVEKLNLELEKRKVVLDYLVKKDIHSLRDVSQWIQHYYKTPDEVLALIAEDLKK